MGNVTAKTSGDIASFMTPAETNIRSLKVHFSPKQLGEGDPSPDNVREIVGWDGVEVNGSGKNIAHIVGYSAQNSDSNNSRIISNSYGTTINTTEFSLPDTKLIITQTQSPNTSVPQGYQNGYIAVLVDNLVWGQKYNISFKIDNIISNPLNVSSTNLRLLIPKGDSYSSSGIQDNRVLFKNVLWQPYPNTNVNRRNFEIRICGMSFTLSEFMVTPVDEDDFEYEPYQGNMYSKDWSSDVGTVYGGYVDLISGELVETNVRDLLDAVNKENLSTEYNTSQTVFFRCDTDYTFETKKGTVTGISDFYCESLKPVSRNWGSGDSQDSLVNTITQRYRSTNAVCMRMYNSVFDINADDTVEIKKQKINTWLAENPIIISYKLAEPIIHQLTPTQLSSFIGQNNFWSNADYVEIEYELKETEDIQKARKKIILNQPHIESINGDIVNFTTNMKAPLKECKVYFEPVQEGSGDPSPDNVRNIIGWDGVSVGLPSEYQEVEYVSSTDKVGQYIDTGENVKETIRVKIKWKFNSVTNWQAVFGGKGTTFCVQRNVTSSNINAQSYGYSNLNIYTLSTNNTIVETELTANQCTNNGVTVELRKSSTYYDGTIWLFAKEAAHSTNIDVKGGCDIYWCQLYDGENLLHNFIPCYRKSDSEIGMYDTVSKTFYTNAGTGTFLKGEDVNNITTNISWSDSVGTIYGGYVDLVKGEVVAEYFGFIADGENIKTNSGYVNDTSYGAGIVYMDRYGFPDSDRLRVNTYCNTLNPIRPTSQNCVYWATNGGFYLVFYPFSKTTEESKASSEALEETNEWLKQHPTQIVYKLRTPIRYQLTPQQLLTFKGENNIWSDTNGQTEVKFWTH